MKESDILRSCLDLLSVRHIYHWRQNASPIPLAGGGFRKYNGKKGLPDIWIILPPHGTLVACEVKMPGKKMSEHQKQFHEELVGLGGVSLCVTSVDELESDLKALVDPGAS